MKGLEPEYENNGGGSSRRRRLSVSAITGGDIKSEIMIDEADKRSSPTDDPDSSTIKTLDLRKTAQTAVTRDKTLASPKRSRGSNDSTTCDAHQRGHDESAQTTLKRGRRLSVSGRMYHEETIEPHWESKKYAVKHSSDLIASEPESIKDQLKEMGIGYACHKGLKPESPNQDDFFIIRIDDWGLYGVFDGHGPFGHDVSNFVQREFPKQLYSDHFLEAASDKIEQIMKDGFEKVQKRLEQYCQIPSTRTCATLSGSTASIVYHRILEKRLICAHVGDSRVVVGRRGPNGMIAIELAQDHKPNNPEEKKRIEERGGVVRKIPGDIPHRVFLQGKMFPGLAMSRALGDLVGHKAGVICVPDVIDYRIHPDDEFLILASDGIWEFFSSEQCVKRVADYKSDEILECVEVICQEAWDKWKEEEGSVVDDITLEVVYLNSRRFGT